ncbi:MAG: GTP cyclohydrolase FolE2 [Treponemataceae bacterium]
MLKDIQNSQDTRKIELDKAGIKGLRYPIAVLDKVNKVQHTAAIVDLYVNLPKEFKGTHMSRFVDEFNKHAKKISMKAYLEMLEAIRIRLDAATAYGKLRFPYFIEKEAPVSKQKAVMSYDCEFAGRVSADDRHFTVAVKVPVQTLCPCSKEISDFGAHNQRAEISIRLEIGSFFWLEDLIALAEAAASSPVYSLLKREDEKFVTEQSYCNPKFVEDTVRDVCLALPRLGDFPYCEVEAESFESIHNHNAFASATGACIAGRFVQS